MIGEDLEKALKATYQVNTNCKYKDMALHKGDIVLVEGRRQAPPKVKELLWKIEEYLEKRFYIQCKIKKVFFDDANGNCGSIYLRYIFPAFTETKMESLPQEAWIDDYSWHLDWDVCSLETIADSWRPE